MTQPTEAFTAVLDASRAAAAEVPERPRDPMRSFLESTLEAAIATRLPGRTELSQQRRRWRVAGFEPYPYGVDIDWRYGDVHGGIEVKVSDAIDSLFDVVKLATALGRGLLDVGFCATAATASQWARGGSYARLTAAPVYEWQTWEIEQLLADAASRRAVLVTDGPRPYEIPAQVETMRAAEIPMPKAPTHTLRLLAVRPCAAAAWLRLPLG